MNDDKAGSAFNNAVKGFDVNALVLVEVYADPAAGEIRKLTPVNEHGVRDTTRFVRFYSNITLLAGGRQLRVDFEIPAGSLSEAIEKFPVEAAKAGADYLEKLEQAQMRARLQGQTAAASVKPLVLPN